MRQFLVSAVIKLIVATLLLYASYYLVHRSYFSYLFVANILLLTGSAILIEGIAGMGFTLFKGLRRRKTAIVSTSRSTFIVIFIADVIIRLTGVMQTYPEQADGRYFSTSQQEKLDSWYWIHTPNTLIENKKKEFLFKRNVNSIGISEQEIAKEKGSKFRILAIGDSFTEGVGESYEKSWVKQMEKRWESHNVQTINAGIGGSDPVYEFALYRDKLTQFKPDLVVLTINSTDPIDIIERGGFERFRKDGTSGKGAPSWEWIYASNHLFRMIMRSAFGYNTNLVKSSYSEKSRDKSIKTIQETIAKFKELTTREETELLVVIQPALQEFGDGKHVPFYGQTRLVKFLKTEKIQYIDVSKAFKKMEASASKYYYPFDNHFTPEGYKIFGNAVYKKIEELDILDN